MQSEKNEIMQHGFNGFLTKPVKANEILKIINNFIL
jgi:CheY-like chemotaxis protein